MVKCHYCHLEADILPNSNGDVNILTYQYEHNDNPYMNRYVFSSGVCYLCLCECIAENNNFELVDIRNLTIDERFEELVYGVSIFKQFISKSITFEQLYNMVVQKLNKIEERKNNFKNFEMVKHLFPQGIEKIVELCLY